MAEVELIYFEGRGLAETIRMTLVAADIKFKETYLKSREQFLALVPELLFQQVPLLRIDGLNLVQSRAIIHYVAKKAKLFGHNDAESAKIDMLFEGAKDFYQGYSGVGFNVEASELREKMAPAFKKYFPIFSKVLKDNGSTGYLVGKSLTIADLALLEVVLATKDYVNDVLEDYPEIQGFMESMKTERFYEKYINVVRHGVNTPIYIASVKQILAYPQ